ncbi:MAG: tetratricopeptide repeat protein [Cyanobacteria bacterium]|nr:tetratricopeptide repeat protein [Cyanobacteriota bacterium]
MAALSQKGDLSEARALFTYALSEARKVAPNSELEMITLCDLGVIDFKSRQFEQAIHKFKQALAIEQLLESGKSKLSDRRLVLEERARVLYFTALSYEKVGKKNPAMRLYLATMKQCLRRLNESPIDLASCERLSASLKAYCNLAKTPADLLAIEEILRDHESIGTIPGDYTEELKVQWTEAKKRVSG